MIKIKENAEILEKRKEMEQEIEEENFYIEQDNTLKERLDKAQENIVNLEEESQKLKEQRPALLADCKDVSKLNKRLKEIEEEIEINKDTITGIEAKRSELENTIYNHKNFADTRYEELVKLIVNELKKDYTKLAIKFSELLNEIFSLEYVGRNNAYCWFGFIHPSDINKIPNLDDERHPHWENNYFHIAGENRDRIMEKYNLPERKL